MVNWRSFSFYPNPKKSMILGGESDFNLAYGNIQKGAISPMVDDQLQSQHPDSVPYTKSADQLGPPLQRPDSAQSMSGRTKNGPQDLWMSPKEQSGIGGPKDGSDGMPVAGREGPRAEDKNISHIKGLYGAPSTRSTPGLGPATNGAGSFGPEFPSSGRSSGEST
jgi:hypothetical protein